MSWFDDVWPHVLVPDTGSNISALRALRELVDDAGVELLSVGNRDVQRRILVPDDNEDADGFRELDAHVRNASMFSRDGGRTRMAMRAWTGRPRDARSSSRRAPRITARRDSDRVRSSAVVGVDATGGIHPGLPWAGCSIRAASAEELVGIREKAANADEMFVPDMPARKAVARLVKKLPLLT